MAVFAFTDAAVTVNSVDLSDHVRSATITVEAEELESTAMGTSGYRSRIAGLKDWHVEIEWNQDFAASKVDATIFPLIGTVVTVTVKATSGANSSTNPQYSGSVLVNDYSPLDGSVGELATTSSTWPGAGTLSRLTS